MHGSHRFFVYFFHSAKTYCRFYKEIKKLDKDFAIFAKSLCSINSVIHQLPIPPYHNLRIMSAHNLAESALHARIRDKLTIEGIKLWLEPFYDETQHAGRDTEILALSARYATELEFPEASVAECVYALQRMAIEKLAERTAFQSTGVATIRLRYSGFTTAKVKPEDATNKIQIDLKQTTGKQLKERIAATVSSPENGLKIICAGKVLEDNKTLDMQNVKNGSQIMILSIATDHETLQEAEEQFKELEETKQSADFLSEQDGTNGLYSLQVTDQSGKALNLPDLEKKALTVALALHEKGRAFMKEKQYSKSLIFLLESDSVYNQCQSSILEMVDNYGLLNLDVAWCYLSLESISELPQVEARLKRCERALLRSYGEDMERVIALKGSSGWEAALYVRLHLLQGITSYHLGHIEKSKFYLGRAEGELVRLRISDDSLVELINMGYGPEEARMALRSTYGDITTAVDWIIRKREEKAVNKQKDEEDLKRRKLQKKLGKCINGDPVNVDLYRQLKAMGYSAYIIPEALRQTNNDANEAVMKMLDKEFENNVLTTVINGMSASNAAASTSTSQNPSSSISTPLAAAIANISELAATLPVGALDSNTSDSLASAMTALSSNPEAMTMALNAIKAALNEGLSEEALAAAALTPTLSEEEVKKSKKAYDTLAKDLHSEEEYIDLALDPENTYLAQYKALLSSL